MQTLTADLLERLANIDDETILSIHVPTERGGPATEKSRIHLKNALDDAREFLEGRGLSEKQSDRRLEPLKELVSDHEYWQHQREGLSIFQYDDKHVEISSESSVRPMVQVGHRPHLVPLVEQIGFVQPYSVLALSGNDVALYRVQGETIQRREVPGLLEKYEDIGRYIDTEKSLQFHSSDKQGRPGGSPDAVFHGQGAGNESDRKLRFREFATMIDQAVSKHLRNSTPDPLLVLAAEPLHTIYHDANTYDGLISTDAAGNTDHLSPRQIQDAAQTQMKSVLSQQKADALADIKDRLGSDGVLFDLQGIIDAATDGRLERVIGASDEQVWGVADLDSAPREITVHDEREVGDEDLHNVAMVTSHRTGAEVIAMPADRLPEGKPLLGLRRF